MKKNLKNKKYFLKQLNRLALLVLEFHYNELRGTKI